jgi:hypothetical protein
MKPEHPSHRPELRSTADQAKGKVLFIFSDAHLVDLKTSENPYRDQDLRFMGEYVEDNYFAVDVKLEFQCYLADPFSAFYSKDYEAADNIYKNFSVLTNIFDQLGDTSEALQLKNIFNTFLERPLSLITSMPNLETMEPGSKEWLFKIFPDFSPEMTMKQLMENNMRFALGFKDDKKEMRKIRNFIAKNLNRDNYSWDNWKHNFNLKFKDTPFNKTFLEMVDGMLGEHRKNHLYSKITNAYMLLEWYNVTEERTSKGPKQFTFTSLNQDAQHVYYAAFCDYLVTDDLGMQLKAFIIYQLFNIPTRVLTTQDFINRNHQISNNEDTFGSFKEALIYDLRHAFLLFSKPDIQSDNRIDTYRTNHVYFNYVNRMQLVQGPQERRCVLYCERISFSNFFLYREIASLSGKLTMIFGTDDDLKGEYLVEEKAPQPYIRKWTLGNTIFKLFVSSNEQGNYLGLCLIFGV